MTDIQRLIGTNSAIFCKTSEEWDILSKLTNNTKENHFDKSQLHLFSLKYVGFFLTNNSFIKQYNFDDFDSYGNFTQTYLLNEVKKRYPIGTIVKSVFEKPGKTYLSDNIQVVEGGYYWASRSNAPSCKSNVGYMCLYTKGLWAEIVENAPQNQFEVGKWYKNLGKDNKCYAKCIDFKDDKLYLSDLIDSYKKHSYSYSYTHFTKESYNKAELLTDLLEILEFLPNDHIDKIQYVTSDFPQEGCVYGNTDDLMLIVKYLLKRPFNKPDNTTSKDDAIGIGWNYNSCWWLKTNKSTKKEYKLSDLKKILNIDNKKDDFVLPEQWCFKVTETNYNKFKHLRLLTTSGGYITNIPYSNLSWGKWSLKIYGEEITFEQFKKYVLDEEENKIIDSYIDCDACNGEGRTMISKLYPNGHHEEWETCDVCNGEGYIVTCIKSNNNFILPEKWQIIITPENLDFINSKRDRLISVGSIMTSNLIDKDKPNSWMADHSKSYQEITFEQFQKYVLKESDVITNTNHVSGIVKKPISKNELNLIIPQIIKPKSQIDYNLSIELPKLELNLPKNQPKIIKQIKLNKYSITI